MIVLKRIFKFFLLLFAVAVIGFMLILFYLPDDKSPMRIVRFLYYQRLAENFMSLFWRNFITSEVLYTGKYVYAGTVDGIAVFDARREKNIKFLRNVHLYGRVGHLSREGNTLYATGGASGFFILDVSLPGRPKIVGKLNLFQKYYVDDGAVKNGIVYLSTERGLVVVDAKDRRHPRVVRLVPGKFFKWLHLSKDKLYVCQEGKGLLIFDLFDPLNPLLLSSLQVYIPLKGRPVPIDPPPRWVLGLGDYAYLANGFQGMTIVNVKNPRKPFVVKHVKTGAFCDQIALISKYLAVRVLPFSVVFYDISQPWNPIPVKTIQGVGFPRGGIHGKKVIFMGSLGGFHIADIRHPLSMKILGSYQTKPVVRDIRVRGKYVYLASGSAGLQIYKLVHPDKPQLVSTLSTTGLAMHIEMSYPYVFVANGISGVDVVDVRNAGKPVLKTTFNNEQRNWGVAQDKDALYIAAGSMGLTMYNVKNPLKPIFMAGRRRGMAFNKDLRHDYFFNVAVASPYVYVMGFLGNVGLLNLRVKEKHAVFPYQAAMPQVCDVKRKGKIIYMGYRGGIQVASLENNNLLKPVKNYRTGGLVLGLDIEGNRLYAADYKKGVFVFDIHNPLNLKKIAHFYTRGNPGDVDAVGKYCYVADGEAGLATINLTTGGISYAR